MAYSWTQPQWALQNSSITALGYTLFPVIVLDNTYSTHFMPFGFSAPALGDIFTLSLYGFLDDDSPGDVPYLMGSVTSSTTHFGGGAQAGYNNVGYLLVKEVPAQLLFVEINVTTYNGPLNGGISVISSEV
jgi:hypothetical protein